MGVESRKPPLPAPTDPSTLESAAESATGTDLATDVSRRTEKSSYSVPADGSPITISTRRRKHDRAKDAESTLTRASHQSQTSLLIEYFEAGKSGSNVQSRPSVRVKVTPSAARKIKNSNDHVEISETGKNRQPSYTKRISLSPNVKGEKQVTESGDEKSLSSYASATEESNLAPRGPPVEIEVMQNERFSPRSVASSPRDSRYVQPNPSDISSMPPDSLLETHTGTRTPHRQRSRSLTRDETVPITTTLKTPSRRRSRSLSRERITKKVIEKLGAKPGESSSKSKRSSKSRSRSVSKEHLEGGKSSRRRSSKSHREEDFASGPESSLLTNSQLTPKRKSGDQYSFKSGTSKSSLNNPKLLESVEDAIRRLILPELNALRDEQKSQHNRSKFEKGQRESIRSGSSTSREDIRHRVSTRSSAPDMARKPKVVLNRDERGPGVVLSGDSIKGRKERKDRKGLADSPSDGYDRSFSEETVRADKSYRKQSKDAHKLATLAAAGSAGALTAAALRHHDSKSSVDKAERRKRRSKSRSRSASVVDSMDTMSKEEIPPMPMSSEIQGSEVTRESILTARTDRPPSATSQERVHDLRGPESPALQNSAKGTLHSPYGLQTHFANASRGDLSLHSVSSGHKSPKNDHVTRAVAAGINAAAGGTSDGQYDIREEEMYDGRGQTPNYDSHTFSAGHGRALSPIQSVASYREDSTMEPPNRDSFRHTQSSGSLSSQGQASLRQESVASVDSLTSSPLKKSMHGYRLRDGANQDRRASFQARQFSFGQPSKDDDSQYWDEQHQENDRNRSLQDAESKDPTIDVRHMTNYTDDSLDGTYLDKVAAVQHVLGVGANPEYRHTPVAVSSAVASLHEPSVVDARSTVSGRSRPGDPAYSESLTDYSPEHDRRQAGFDPLPPASQGSSPTKSVPLIMKRSVQSTSQRSLDEVLPTSPPPKSAKRHISDHGEYVPMGASGLPVADDPMPEIGHGLSDESDINTNPSIIQGPIGGTQHENRDHWPYEPTPPQSNGNRLSGQDGHDDDGGLTTTETGVTGASAGLGLGVLASHRRQDHKEKAEGYGYEEDERSLKGDLDRQATVQDQYDDEDFGPDVVPDSYLDGKASRQTPLKDEGYISAAHPRSAGATPEPDRYGLDTFEQEGLADDDDPFVAKGHRRHMSGNSHGMASPLYDSSTGRGIDRIQSKDIVALMDHLTVRDAQRNARDTEMLITLVRSAAEMRNSFEDMKRLLAEQENTIINSTEKNTERTVQRAMHGPRPQPLGTPRAPRRTSAEEDMIEDIPAKRRNVFRRALKGLSSRSTNDLAKIEDMLVQLLGDVEGLKAAQDTRPGGSRGNSLNSFDNLQAVPEGYEPEGQAGTGSTNQSGSLSFSNPPSRQTSAMRGVDGRRASEHRVSTVPEADEEHVDFDEPSPQAPLQSPEEQLTPTRQPRRGSSVPLDTPPQAQVAFGTQSNEHTPRMEKGKKHRSSNTSSIFPKISRWSETTASTVARQFRGSGRKDKEYLEAASRSGSEPSFWDSHQHEPRGADKLPITYSRESTPTAHERPPSPLIPDEDPKYQAHRDSLNLQHPQPRPGPTYRYQNQLETEAQQYDRPVSMNSEQWGSSNSNPNRFSGGSGYNNRHSGGAGNLSPISDAGYSEASAADQTAPPRPPKVPEEPLVPQQRAGKLRTSDNKPTYASPLSAGHLAPTPEEQRYSDDSAGYNQMNGSPRSASGQVPARKPTGPRPRPMSSTSSQGMEGQRNRNRDTFGLSGTEPLDKF
ncbi:MAG: hypothetical protein M1817_002305 [Caeruleum heppii]|nr:MAG: hypothetical protein M1817_003510 [Caeruleum heppii]KAI9673667.1 MAG: hypothetical protein M1817_002305 [Caeruleum heppii]